MAPKARLKKVDYVEAAFRIFTRSGAEGTTVRALGDELGVDATAVYRHFRNKDALIIAMVGMLLEAELNGTPLEGAPGEKLRTVARVARSVLMTYPELAHALANASEGVSQPTTMTKVSIASLEELGYRGDELVIRYQALESSVIGSCLFDGGSAPRHFVIRVDRYRCFEDAAFSGAARSTEAVEHLTNKGYDFMIEALVDRIVAEAPVNSKK